MRCGVIERDLPSFSCERGDEKPAQYEKAGAHENRSALNSAKVSTPPAAPPPRVK